MFDKDEMKARTEAAMKEWQAQIDKLHAQAKEMQGGFENAWKSISDSFEKARKKM